MTNRLAVDLAAVQTPHWRALPLAVCTLLGQAEAGTLSHLIQRAVFRSIIDNDDLKLRVIQLRRFRTATRRDFSSLCAGR